MSLEPTARSRARILVVDDEAGPRESLRMIPAPHFSVETATGASDALGIPRTAVQGIRLGASDYLTKPFDVAAVLALMQRTVFELERKQHLARFLEGNGDVLGRDRSSSEMLGEEGALLEMTEGGSHS